MRWTKLCTTRWTSFPTQGTSGKSNDYSTRTSTMYNARDRNKSKDFCKEDEYYNKNDEDNMMDD